MNRRHFLKQTATASVSLLAMPALAVKRKPHVVVVGGGFGGATAAKYLSIFSGGDIDVTLIEQNAEYVSCPMSNLVLVGLRDFSYCVQRYDQLVREWGVKFVQQKVKKIDKTFSRVVLEDHSQVNYDRLIIAPGIDLVWDSIEGMTHADAHNVAIDAWRDGFSLTRLRDQIQSIQPGGTIALSIPLAPYRCPPAPYERASLVAWYLKKFKPGATIQVYDANPEITSEKDLFLQFWSQHYQDVLFYHPNNTLVGVDISQKKLHFEFEELTADVLNVIPPMRAGKIVVQAGLATANDKWCEVDFLDFQSRAASNIHILGDSIQIAPLMAKAGHMASQHGRTCAYAVSNALLKREPDVDPMYSNTCFSFVSDTHAMHVASVHRYSRANRTMEPIEGAGGVSIAPNKDEQKLAFAWAQAIWSDVFH